MNQDRVFNEIYKITSTLKIISSEDFLLFFLLRRVGLIYFAMYIIILFNKIKITEVY